LHRFLHQVLLTLPALLCACSTDSGGGPAPQPATSAEPQEPAATGEASEATAAPAPKAELPAGPVTGDPASAPRRAPAFDFAPGGPIADAELGAYHVALSCAVDGTDVGTMTVGLWAETAPITARNFLRLCDEGFYDGLTFHRILRDFMVQGGDPTGTGGGNSPYGTIRAEFSDAPERAHRYGVLSMARLGNDENSASCQFFICCDDGPNVWNLDGSYTSFGRITSGVATLEALASVEATGPERSKPVKPVTITRAEVRQGPAPSGETIARPVQALDLGGEPERIVIQHVLISFAGARTKATRTKEEAAALAAEILQRAQAGEDFEALVRTHSDDVVREGDTTPGVYRLLNKGVRDPAFERTIFELERQFRKQMADLQARVQSGAITQEEQQAQATVLRDEAMAKVDALQWVPREGMVPAFGDVGFGLEVGAIGSSEHDATRSPFGWHIIRRLE
jgi:peptidyl-prolyl cis-trans isomerase B (cyclophilin B)